jgi:Sulfotransferase family
VGLAGVAGDRAANGGEQHDDAAQDGQPTSAPRGSAGPRGFTLGVVTEPLGQDTDRRRTSTAELERSSGGQRRATLFPGRGGGRVAEPATSLKVLSIVGAGRSGSTVLASILGEAPGFASAGEIRWLWQRGVRERRPCACGLAPTDCPVWAPVVAATLSAVDDRDHDRALAEIVAAQSEIATLPNRLRVLRSASAPTTSWPALNVVRTAIDTACRSFASATGARVVVDTSKRPHDAAVVAALRDLDLYVLHVVRDPRAVAYSWRREKAFTVAGETRTMGTRRPAASARRWTSNSLGAEVLRRHVPPDRWLRLRYEDFCAAPAQTHRAIMGLLGEEGPSPFEGPDTVRLSPGHIVAGNPSRFTVGSVRIRVDEEWRRDMSARDQRLVGWSTYPLRLRYGYGTGGGGGD